jgi:hypothetical protein
MKKLLQTFTVCTLIFMSSCSKDVLDVSIDGEIQQIEENIDFKSRAKSNSYLQYQGIRIVALDDGRNLEYFEDFQLTQKFIYSGNLNYKTKHDEQSYKIINPLDENEFYEIFNAHVKNDKITFDVKTPEGLVLKNLKFHPKYKSNNQKCPWCWVGGAVVAVIKTIAEESNDSDCETAIKQCMQAGDLPSTKIEEGFFDSSCDVSCGKK